MLGDRDLTLGDRDIGRASPAQARDVRDQSADDRDGTSEAQEVAADARDDRAAARDGRAEARDVAIGLVDAGAASDRAEALRDRRGAARDRAHAAADRAAAWSDRAESAWERVASSIDGLTGARRREAGILELGREVTRAKRTEEPFVLAFVDLDGLKVTNDSLGHAAGDQRLRHLADTIRANFRSYDLIVRTGGDEFVCGLPGLGMPAAAERFASVSADLADAHQASVTVGLAELGQTDSLEDLLLRADDALYAERHLRPARPA